MVNIEKNRQINQALSNLYKRYSEDYLAAYRSAFRRIDAPCRINEFGIIDVTKYDTDQGILFLAKESNGWSNEEFESGNLFRGWVEGISKNGVKGKGHVQRHPNMWYNLGRWALYLKEPERSVEEVASCRKDVLLSALGSIAFTNLNKVRGENHAGREYRILAGAEITGQLLREELEVLCPRIVVCCGTVGTFRRHASGYSGAVINMPHPAARVSKVGMLHQLAAQYPQT